MSIENEEERDFSVELVSKTYLKRLSANDSVLMEGTLGKLQHVLFVEPEILEVKGSCGVLRLNVKKCEVEDTVIEDTGGDGK